MIYVAKVKRHLFSKSHKVDFLYKENAVDYCRKHIRAGWWARIIEKEGN